MRQLIMAIALLLVLVGCNTGPQPSLHVCGAVLASNGSCVPIPIRPSASP
jgi:hypothetical protein